MAKLSTKKGEILTVIFKDKIFHLYPTNPSTWKKARAYGAQKLNIPAEQFDFYPTKIAEGKDWYNR